jgi:UDP-N-acetylglucosamine diphosphorylase/glucosamine-1-phosphate N-acetyltransferase
MNILLHDSNLHLRFAPLTLTRPVGNLRMGIFTNDERWKKFIPEASVFFQSESYLQKKFPSIQNPDIIIHAAVIPNQQFVNAVLKLNEGEQLVYKGETLAQRGQLADIIVLFEEDVLVLSQRWHLYQFNKEVLELDFQLITQGRTSAKLSSSNTVIGDPSLVFLEEGASIEACILNTKEGPIYLGKNSEVMEGSMLRGPFALCENAGVKMGAKIYGATTIGVDCRVGGEISNCIFQSYSNKGHDGFLGNSLIGEWCNLGADTNTSNLKNNYGKVATYSYESRAIEKTDIQFMGLTMGDHSKCGINTMFNTATVVGVSANIFGAGFPEKVINSFTWGGADETVRFKVDKAIEVAKAMMSRRKITFTEGDQAIFLHLGDK